MKNSRTFLLFFGDIAALIASFFITLALGFRTGLDHTIISSHIWPFALMYLMWLIILFLFNFYDITSVKPTIPHFQKIGLSIMVCFAIGIIFFYTVPIFSITPKTNLVINIVVFALLFLGWRRLFYMIFASGFQKAVVFIMRSPSTIAEDLQKHIEKNPQSGMRVVASYINFETHTQEHQNKEVDVIITQEMLPKTPALLKSVYNSKVEIFDLPSAYENILARVPVLDINETWLLHNLQNVRNGVYETVTSVIGFIVALLLLIVTLPITLIIALVIKLQDGGPIFYTQQRVGKNGKPFTFYKFRSMIINAEKDGVQWAQKNDSRVTTFGRVIRKLHLDELPQMINILKGDMALVGPRPERPEFVDQLEQEIPYYHLRHLIKPGFTGWGQIKFRYGRSIVDAREKFEYDLYYIKNRNLFMDLGIILRTIQIIFTH